MQKATGRRSGYRSGSFSMKTIAATAGLVLFGSVLGGAAQAACYSPKEAAAEQAIRLHSEVMVVGLSCAVAMGDANLFAKYVDFTSRNAPDLRQHEQAMINFFAHHGEGNAKRRFDNWRTSIANAVSTRAALTSTQLYCNEKRDLMTATDASYAFGAEAVNAMLVTAPEAAITSLPLCNQGAVALSTTK
jgi:hypothetical protein